MDIIRIIAGIIILVFFLWGLKRGLIRQVFEVVGLIAAFVGAFYLAHHFAIYLEGRFDLSYRIALVISALLIFAGIIFVFHFIGIALQKLFKMTLLGSFDRFMGGIFGALKGVILMSLVFVIFLSLPFQEDLQKEIIDDPFTGAIYPVLPVLFDLVISRTGTDFADVARIDHGDKIEKLLENADKIGDRIEKEKERMDRDQ